jgi:hypothetical protein
MRKISMMMGRGSPGAVGTPMNGHTKSYLIAFSNQIFDNEVLIREGRKGAHQCFLIKNIFTSQSPLIGETGLGRFIDAASASVYNKESKPLIIGSLDYCMMQRKG